MKKLKLFTILSAFILLASCGSGGTTNNNNNGGNTPFNPFIPGGTTSQTVNPGTPSTNTNPFTPIGPGTTSQSTPSTSSSVAGNTYVSESSMSGYNAEIEFSYGNSVTYRINNNGMSSILTGTYSQNGNSLNMTFTYGTTTYNGQTQSTSVNQSMEATVSGNSLTLNFQGLTEVYSLKNGGNYNPTPSYPSVTPSNPSVSPTYPSTTPSTSTNLSGRTFSTSMPGVSLSVSFSGNQVTYYTNAEGMTSYFYGTYSVSGNQVTMNFTSVTGTYNGQTYTDSISQTMYGTVSGSTLSMTMEGVTLTLTEGGSGYTPTPTPSYPSVNPGTSTSLSGKSYSANSYGAYASISFSGSNVTYAVTAENMESTMYGTYSVSGSNVTMTFNSGYYTYQGETQSLSGLNQTINATLSGSSITLQIEEGAYLTLYEGGSYTPTPTPTPTPSTNTMANRSFSYSADGNTMTLSFTSSEVTMSASAAGQSASYSGTYYQSGNTIYMTFTFQGQTQSMTGTLSGSQLSVTTGYATMIFYEI